MKLKDYSFYMNVVWPVSFVKKDGRGDIMREVRALGILENDNCGYAGVDIIIFDDIKYYATCSFDGVSMDSKYYKMFVYDKFIKTYGEYELKR